jgi:hypothetical protein
VQEAKNLDELRQHLSVMEQKHNQAMLRAIEDPSTPTDERNTLVEIVMKRKDEQDG